MGFLVGVFIVTVRVPWINIDIEKISRYLKIILVILIGLIILSATQMNNTSRMNDGTFIANGFFVVILLLNNAITTRIIPYD